MEFGSQEKSEAYLSLIFPHSLPTLHFYGGNVDKNKAKNSNDINGSHKQSIWPCQSIASAIIALKTQLLKLISNNTIFK